MSKYQCGLWQQKCGCGCALDHLFWRIKYRKIRLGVAVKERLVKNVT